MQVIQKQAIVAYSAQQMYTLVNDIAAYPEFVPWCSGAQILTADDSQMTAQLEFRAKGVHKAFTTRNQLQPNLQIDLQLLNGPFKQLHGVWQFQGIPGGGCQVSLNLHFEFEQSLFAIMFSGLFTRVADQLVDCFCQRANQVYAP